MENSKHHIRKTISAAFSSSHIGKVLGILAGCSALLILWYSIALLDQLSGRLPDSVTFGLWFIVWLSGMFLPVHLFFKISDFQSGKQRKTIWKYRKLISKLEKYNTDSLQNIDEILKIADNLYIILSEYEELGSNIQKIRIKGEYEGVTEKNITITKLFFKEQLKKISTVLSNLRASLYKQLESRKQSLESAKTEVEKNITGTPELLGVSEAQQLRLDRQIEQFEELQRVLVQV